MRDIKTSEALNLAADLIQVHGWGRGPQTWMTENAKGVCIEGAIAAVMGVDTVVVELDNGESRLPSMGQLTRCPAYEAVIDYLGGAEQIGWLFHWNDRPGRTQEEVIAVLRAVAVIEEAKERSEVKDEVAA